MGNVRHVPPTRDTPPRRWLIRRCRKEPITQLRQLPTYYAAIVTEPEHTPSGETWEEFQFSFQAPSGQGPRVLRLLCAATAAAPCTAQELRDRAQRWGRIVHTLEGGGPRELVPASWPVQPLTPEDEAQSRAICGTCGLAWDDGKVTSMTPTPAGRCPFESWHEYDG